MSSILNGVRGLLELAGGGSWSSALRLRSSITVGSLEVIVVYRVTLRRFVYALVILQNKYALMKSCGKCGEWKSDHRCFCNRMLVALPQGRETLSPVKVPLLLSTLTGWRTSHNMKPSGGQWFPKSSRNWPPLTSYCRLEGNQLWTLTHMHTLSLSLPHSFSPHFLSLCHSLTMMRSSVGFSVSEAAVIRGHSRGRSRIGLLNAVTLSTNQHFIEVHIILFCRILYYLSTT